MVAPGSPRSFRLVPEMGGGQVVLWISFRHAGDGCHWNGTSRVFKSVFELERSPGRSVAGPGDCVAYEIHYKVLRFRLVGSGCQSQYIVAHGSNAKPAE